MRILGTKMIFITKYLMTTSLKFFDFQVWRAFPIMLIQGLEVAFIRRSKTIVLGAGNVHLKLKSEFFL